MIYTFTLSVLLLAGYAAGFASWFTADYCDTPLEAGEVIMNHEATMSDERKVEIFRGTEQLKNGDSFVPGEVLTAVLSGEDAGEMVWESNFGVFEYGGCDDHRSTLSTSTVNIPEDLTDPIEFWAGKMVYHFESDLLLCFHGLVLLCFWWLPLLGWAFSHNTVWIAEKLILVPPGGIQKPAATKAIEIDSAKPPEPKSHEKHQAPVESQRDRDEQVFQQVNAQMKDKYFPNRQKNKHKLLADKGQLYQMMEGYLMVVGVICIAAVIFVGFYYKRKILAMLGMDDTNLMKSY
jgi:hypothetical protein